MQFIVQRHFTESQDPDVVTLWNDIESAKKDYDDRVKAYRRIGCPEMEDRRVELAQNPGGAYARTVFRNEDETITIFTLKDIKVSA